MQDAEQQLCVLVLRALLEQIRITHVSAAFVINESFLVALSLIRGLLGAGQDKGEEQRLRRGSGAEGWLSQV